MNNYCIGFNIYNFKTDYGTDKVKIDYFIVPVSVVDGENGIYKSKVGTSVFSGMNLKKIFGKNYYYSLSKKKDSVNFKIVIYTEDSLELSEKNFLPKIEKYLRKKLFLRPKFKKALEERVKRILLTN